MMNGTRTVEAAPFARSADEEPWSDEEWSALQDEPEDEEVWDEEGFDEESLGNVTFLEARRRPTRTRVNPIRRTPTPTIAGGPASIQIPTQRGPIQATLSERFVTPQQLTEALRKLEENTAKNFADTKKELQRVDQSAITRDEEVRRDLQRGLSAQSKLLKRHVKETKRAYGSLKREVAEVKQTSLLMALLNKPEGIQSLTLSSGVTQGATTLNVANTTYKSGNSLLPILLLSGGLGSGGDSSTLLLALAMSGGL